MSHTFIVYISKRTDHSPDLARDIAIASSQNNQRLGVTGILMGVGDHFVQALEGNLETVEQLVSKIAKDPRHDDLRVIYQGEISERIYGRWNMGCITPLNSEPGERHFQDIGSELKKICEAEDAATAEAIKDLLVEIPKRIANSELGVSNDEVERV